MTDFSADQNIHKEKILILDFGSQYTQLIARRVREVGVYCEIHPWDYPRSEAENFAPRGIILSGGPESVTADDTLRAPEYVFDMDVPVLGICYGMQVMALQLGGSVSGSEKQEFGYARVAITGDSHLLRDIYDEVDGDARYLDVWMSHGDKVVALPEGFSGLAVTDNTDYAAMFDDERRLYGLQFHPEVAHTLQGMPILHRFVIDICGCQGLWTPANIVEDIINSVRARVGSNDQVILGLSGGVDSSVVAALLSRAIGRRLTCVFVDNGLLRRDEVAEVIRMLGKGSDNVFELNIISVDAEETFLKKLAGVTDPEEKRKIIGNTFIEIFDEQAASLEDV
ncbi:MAG: glutamine-hydrolyzing GMP synthase, partial [Pseudomonadales bacterium]